MPAVTQGLVYVLIPDAIAVVFAEKRKKIAIAVKNASAVQTYLAGGAGPALTVPARPLTAAVARIAVHASSARARNAQDAANAIFAKSASALA